MEKRFQDLVRDTSEVVATDIEEVWRRASLPTVEHRTILARIKAYHDKYRAILKPYQGRKNSENYKNKLERFKIDSRTLFDIATCKCSSFQTCVCDKSRKIPTKEGAFLSDQRGQRKMMISSLDRETTKKNEANISRKLQPKLHDGTARTPRSQTSTTRIMDSDSKPSKANAIMQDNHEELPTLSTVIIPSDNRFPIVARTLDRYRISDRAGAAIVSATLQGIGLVTDNDTSNVIDRNKIRRARTKARTTLTANNLLDFDHCIGIYFDGRKDKTFLNEDNRRKVVIEEHLSLLKETGSQYIGHISVESGDAKTITNKLYAYFSAESINLKHIMAIGCDGTAVNTGNKAGVIRQLEGKLQRPLQWLVCQLHANELTLRHLFEHLDGATTGPKSFNGPVGKSLDNCENLVVIKFRAIKCNLPEITKSREDLSTDQLYLLEICRAINEGRYDDNLAKRNPGKICHSRWLTTANRILRIYISTETPSENLLTLSKFVLRVYAPMWLRIKTEPLCVYGTRHLHDTVVLTRYLPDDLKKVVDPVIQRNGYFGHSENILIAMLADQRRHIKELALRRIKKIRTLASDSTPIRVFSLPKFNFNAEDYIDLIAWEQMSELPLTKQISNDTISDAIADLDKIETEILPNFRLMPCHSQATERCVKLVTESCAAVCGSERPTGEEEPKPLPCVVYVHGESYEWNSGNPYDGTVLASTGRVIVVTINFRLGVLGFLKTGTKGSAQGNFGLMDLVAGLHWLRENLPAFGGDPERVTLMGHSTGAALVNFIAVSPVAKELLHRVILLSGSGLSPWALQRDPLSVKLSVAQHTNCHGDLNDDDLAPCLRRKPLSDLLNVRIDSPRFLSGFAPFIDGTILVNPTSAPPMGSTATVATSAGYELADFPERDLLFGLTSTESYLDLNAQDLEFGFNETRRDRILRTYVRNSYYYHLNEIFSTLKNEYTDWERPTQNPLSVRDATLDVLSDGHTAAPLIRVGYLHSMRGGKTFFLHFQHQSGDRDFPMRSGSVRGEDLPYILGLPLIGGGPFFPHNYSHGDVTVSKTLIHYISNFVRKGDPNGAVPNASASEASKNSEQKGYEEHQQQLITPYWDTYDTINQLYLELGNRPEMRNHYRGHKMSLWLNLIPQLHRPGEGGGDDVSMRHHHFQEEDEMYYDGVIRPQNKERPPLVHVIAPPPAPPPPPTTTRVQLATAASLSTPSPPPPPPKSDTALQATTTECPPNNTVLVMPGGSSISKNNNNLLRKLASSHYQSYTTALTVTIAVGCFLLLLNIVIFAGIYHQRDRGKSKKKKQQEEMAGEAGSCSSSSGENYDKAYDTARHNMEKNVAMAYECGKSSYELSRTGSFKGGGGGSGGGGVNNGEGGGIAANYVGGGEYHSVTTCQGMTELPLQEFNSSPPPAKRHHHPHHHPHPHDVQHDVMMVTSSATTISTTTSYHPPDVTTTSHHSSNLPEMGPNLTATSPSIPEPPPPPKGQPPSNTGAGGVVVCGNQTGILRPHGAPTTPGTMKKRVQIQEISV